MIIGLVGFIGSGKGTVATILERNGFNRESFAKPVKDVAAAAFGWDRELLEGETIASREWREKPCPIWTSLLGKEITPRKILQLIGTEMFRDQVANDFWVKALQSRIQFAYEPKYVISDVRFPNEIEMIVSLGGKVYEVTRGHNPEWYDIAKEWNRTFFHILNESPEENPPGIDVHYSEWAWIGHPKIEGRIDNNVSLEELEQKIKQLTI